MAMHLTNGVNIVGGLPAALVGLSHLISSFYRDHHALEMTRFLVLPSGLWGSRV